MQVATACIQLIIGMFFSVVTLMVLSYSIILMDSLRLYLVLDRHGLAFNFPLEKNEACIPCTFQVMRPLIYILLALKVALRGLLSIALATITMESLMMVKQCIKGACSI